MKRALPPYAFVPGKTPHPRRDPRGHGFGAPEPKASPETFAYGLELFDAGFFWEAHEALEAMWNATRDPIDRAFYQGIIQIAAAFVKRAQGYDGQALAARGLERLATVPGRHLGVDVKAFAESAGAFFDGSTSVPPKIGSALPAD